jgi:hypothetical protein
MRNRLAIDAPDRSSLSPRLGGDRILSLFGNEADSGLSQLSTHVYV